MSDTRRHDPRDYEDDGQPEAFYAKVKPVVKDTRFPAMLTNGKSIRKARHLGLVK